MGDQSKLVVSHAPFWHDGSRVTARCYHTIAATLPAVLFGIAQYGIRAAAVVALSVSSAVLWEAAYDRAAKRPITVGDGSAAVIGMLFAMMVPATMPWWAVLTGTFIAVVIGRQIFGGIGGNAFNPVCLSLAILTLSWKHLLDFDAALLNYNFDFTALYPLAAAKNFGPASVASFQLVDLLMGKQLGAIGSTFGLGLILGGVYLMARGTIRWEISLSFLVGIILAAFLFHAADPNRFAGPGFHVLTGYTLIGAFFLAPEDSSSPVNFLPMILYGATGGVMTMLIRNIGVYPDGVVLAILVINLIHPLLDKIRPKALGKVV
jgi:electron transport complex protein RnfD